MSSERTERKEIAKWAPSESRNIEKPNFVTANRQINFLAIDAGVKAAIESSHLPTLQECRDGLLLIHRFEEIRGSAIQTKNRIFRYINLIDDELFKIKQQLITRGGSSHKSTLSELGLSKRRSQVLDLKHSILPDAREAYIDECDRACIAATDAGLLKLVRIEKPAAPPLPDGKYGLLYVDLPWEHTCDHNAWFVSPKRHYPVMSEREIVAMAPDIERLAAKDCVMFMWVPACLDGVAHRVLDAWRFRYCTDWVWCKVDRKNPGHYGRSDHELLIIAGRGKATPSVDPKIAFTVSSVQTFSRVGLEHSEKPKEYYNLIERLYPNAKKIELFARGRRAGWASWGNEPELNGAA